MFELPSMQLLSNSEGQKRSITIKGITDWMWVPGKNYLVYTAFFPQEKEVDVKVDPNLSFMKLPQRTIVDKKVFKNSEELRLVMHPQGTYLGVINHYSKKKTMKYQVEIFDLHH